MTSPTVSPADVVAPPVATPVDGVDVLGSLSPSRASDFLTCPLLYRFRTIDRLPEPPSPAAVRGTVVHQVLEDLFDVPAVERTPERADLLLEPAWEALLAAEPDLAQMFAPTTPDGPEVGAWLATCHDTLAVYFDLEDPRRLEPAERELYVESLLESKLLLRGFVDRVDIAPDGAIRIVDYKTGRAPGEGFEAKALFQLKFYALVLWRMRGVVPAMLQLVYLGSGEILRYAPDEEDLRATERKVEAVWGAIEAARSSGQWLPRRSGLCGFCAHRDLCPEFGGTPPAAPGNPGGHSSGHPDDYTGVRSSSRAVIFPAAISSAKWHATR
ncbi:PD-(D/E)XK nuclease family protein [Nocardioides sp.]|uniref:RecB family exonuclease n=1 Tax=Nocardioides sp. TaxID=35761 RepID=UPI002B273FAF|nr:PD-(D/E)XK nuclease family protein [Nocardioides sp.]